MLNGFRLKSKAEDEVRLGWTSPPEPDTAGFLVHHGTSPLNYTGQVVRIDGLTAQYTWRRLPIGFTHYFSVSAFDQVGNVGDKSNEVSQTL